MLPRVNIYLILQISGYWYQSNTLLQHYLKFVCTGKYSLYGHLETT